MAKKWCIAVCCICLLILSGFAAIVYTIDPFFVYREPTKDLAYKYTNEAYQVPGIAKNYKYSNIVTGSSMTENFSTDLINQQFQSDSTVKLCYSGSSLRNQKEILELALDRKDNSTQHVFMSLDLWNFMGDYNEVSNSSPQWILDSNVFNDVQYLLNKDVLYKNIIPIIKDTIHGEEKQTMDSAFRWYGFAYGDSAILNQWMIPDFSNATPTDTNHFIESAGQNIEHNLRPIFEKHPDVDFYVFFPPYSILYWYEQSPNMEAILNMREFIVKKLLPFENVHIFDFQSDTDMITNLWNYKDTKHYSSRINDFIVKCFVEEKNLVTQECEIINNNNNLKVTIQEWDITQTLNNPWWLIDNIYDYIDAIASGNYTVYMTVNEDSSWAWSAPLETCWSKAGSIYNLSENHNYSYIAIWKNGNIKMERLSDNLLKYEKDNIKLISLGANVGGYSSIQIDGIEYSQNSRGLNIVVYDETLKKVVDSICFDTCGSLNGQRMNAWQ